MTAYPNLNWWDALGGIATTFTTTPASTAPIDMLDMYRNVAADPEYLAMWAKMAQQTPSSHQRKLAEAKVWLGSRWILHPANAVKRKVLAVRHGGTL